MASYKKTSLYGTTSNITPGVLDVLDYRPMPFLIDDVKYEIKPQYNYRPDLLASDLYNDSELWWVFKSRNPSVLDDPIFDFVAGVEIYIPSKNTIGRIIGGA